MASARRIALSTAVKIARRVDLSTAVKQWRGIPQWSRREMSSARKIDLSTAVKQGRGIPPWSSNKCPSIHCNKNRDLSTAVSHWRGIPQWPWTKLASIPNRSSTNIRHDFDEIGYTVDVADLLFTPERDFLVKNNGQKIKVDDLRGKTIVLFIVPLDVWYWRGKDVMRPGAGDTWDMIDAYYELLRMGSVVEFVFVPVRLRRAGFVDEGRVSQEALFHHLFSTMPFPAIPFSDVQALGDPVVHTFSVDDDDLDYEHMPYWVVIDPTNTVVATRSCHSRLFKLFSGAELHPLSRERIWDVEASYSSESRVQRISKWDQLLASDTRDFLLSSNGDKVPISSLKGKLVGLYFCENISQPPRMQAIKKVYEEAKSRGYDFEIVQITFHYHCFNARHLGTDPTVQQCCEDISWLTLPFKDPSCRKVQRIFQCVDEEDEYWVGNCGVQEHWVGDSLVLIYPRQGENEDDHSSGVLFELSGAEILQRWGIEGYPFTRPSLYKAEYEIQKREVRLQLIFPPGECLLRRPRAAGDGFDLVDAVSQLSGKRVLVLFAPHSDHPNRVCDVNFLSMLKSEYNAQLEDNVGEENKFEVVYVSTGSSVSSFDEYTKDMPWLVRPFSSKLDRSLWCKVFKGYAREPCAAAFNEQGELIAKKDGLGEKKAGDKLQFPFIDQDLEKPIRGEVEALCDVASYRM